MTKISEHQTLARQFWRGLERIADPSTLDDITIDKQVETLQLIAIETMVKPPAADVSGEYVVWSNEHKCWWGPNNAGYHASLSDAGRYSREGALKICVGARGGRQFNTNPTEIPLLLEDAERFWPDDQEEWRIARQRAKAASCEDEE